MNVNGFNSNAFDHKTTFEKVSNIKPGFSINDDIQKANDDLKGKVETSVVEKETIGKKINTLA